MDQMTDLDGQFHEREWRHRRIGRRHYLRSSNIVYMLLDRFRLSMALEGFFVK